MSAMDDLGARIATFVGRSYGPYRAWDAVNAPMIRQWREAITIDANGADELNPDRAPRTMLNAWMMRGVGDRRPADSAAADPYELVALLREAGYVGVVATQSRQDYVRALRVGERLESAVTVDRISALKQTGLGSGYFVTLRHAYSVAGEPIGTMLFTTLHYIPGAKEQRPAPPQPGISDDTRFFWDGLARDALLAQRCDNCGTLRHPPGPVCSTCHALEWSAIELAGTGTLYSWTVVHHAAHPAFDYAHPIGLIALDEGIRIIAPLQNVAPDELADGLRLQVAFHHVDGEHRFPSFQPISEPN